MKEEKCVLCGYYFYYPPVQFLAQLGICGSERILIFLNEWLRTLLLMRKTNQWFLKVIVFKTVKQRGL